MIWSDDDDDDDDDDNHRALGVRAGKTATTKWGGGETWNKVKLKTNIFCKYAVLLHCDGDSDDDDDDKIRSPLREQGEGSRKKWINKSWR